MESETATLPTTQVNRRWRGTRYLFLLGLGLYLALVWYLGWREVGAELLAARPGYIVATVALIFAGNWVRAAKWRGALGPGHNAWSIFFLSKCSAEWSPGRLGEFSPMVLRRHRTPKVGAWIMLDRLLEVSVTLALGLIGLAVIDLMPPGAYAAIIAVSVGSTILVLYLLTRRSFFLWIANRSRPESWIHRFAMLFAAMSDELYRFSKKVPVALGLTAAAKCGDLWAVSLLFKGFGYSAGFFLVAVAKCALAIVSFLPFTPLATGLPHLTQAGLMNYAAGIPSEGLAAAIGVEVVIVSVCLWSSFGLAVIIGRSGALGDGSSDN